MREYRRDIRRFLKGEMERYPAMPLGYFGEDTAAHFGWFREQALKHRSEETLKALWAAKEEPHLSNIWRPTAARLYANWLSLLMLKKATVVARELSLELGHVHGISPQAFQQ